MSGLWQLAAHVILRAESFGGMAFHRRSGVMLEVDDDAYRFLCACRQPTRLPLSGHAAVHLIPQLVRLEFLCPVEEIDCPHGANEPFSDDPSPTSSSSGPAFLSAPEVVHLAITARCNQHCAGCYVPRTWGDELTVREWQQLIDQWARMRVFQVAIGGGEPLLYEGLFEVLAYARDRGIVPNLTTNGTLLDARVVDRLERAGLGQVNVSWNGPAGDADRTYPVVERALRLLAGAPMRVGLNLLVAPALLDRLPDILAHLQDLGVRQVTLLRSKPPALPDGAGKAWYQAHRLRRADLVQLRRVLSAWQGVLRLHVDSALVGLMGDLHPAWLRRRGVYGCAAGRRICTVWPDGQVTPCSFLADLCAGSARRIPFDALWEQGQGWEALRDPAPALQGRCTGCAIAAQCGGARCIARCEQGDLCAGDDECPAGQSAAGG